MPSKNIKPSGMTGGELRKLRKRAKMTREELADFCGYTPETIGRRERGTFAISIPEADFFRRLLARG